VATIKKAAWNKFYTSELPDVKEERLARIGACEEAVTLLKAPGGDEGSAGYVSCVRRFAHIACFWIAVDHKYPC
jgi:hypothetical protein